MENEHQLFGQSIESAPIDNIPSRISSVSMVIQNFRTAAEGQGKYCPMKNELRVRKQGKVFRFTCGAHELRFASPGYPEVIFSLASDATVDELRRCITELPATSEQHGQGTKNTDDGFG